MTRPLNEVAHLFPDLEPLLPRLNQALRNINFGKMDHLPYYDPIPGYRLAMRADLIPQGGTRPPAIGHWQVEVIRDGYAYVLRLQGKSDRDQEIGELLDPCRQSAGNDT